MNKKEALEIIDKQWIRKPAGYRVQFQRMEAGAWQTVHVPDADKEFYDSDVVAWRIAWKLSQSVQEKDGAPDMTNIRVVDDQGAPIRYYATGDYHVYCPGPNK